MSRLRPMRAGEARGGRGGRSASREDRHQSSPVHADAAVAWRAAEVPRPRQQGCEAVLWLPQKGKALQALAIQIASS